MSCKPVYKADKRYVQRMAAVAVLEIAATFAVAKFVRAHHPAGPELWLMAAIPTIPMVGMLAVIGLYLKDQKDEFRRMQITRSILWAAGVSLAATAFSGFMKNFGGGNILPPFTTFTIFFVVMGLVQGIQGMQFVMNQVKDDE